MTGAPQTILCCLLALNPVAGFASLGLKTVHVSRIAYSTPNKLEHESTALTMASSEDEEVPEMSAVNVLGTPLKCCCADVANTGVDESNQTK